MSVRPRLRVAAESPDESYGDLAGDLASGYQLTPDDWQQLILDDWLAVKGGKWAHLTCGLSVPRQNGKNGALEIRELFGMVGRGEAILHTAHQVKTAQKHFRRLKHFFGKKANDPAAKFPELNALVSEVRNVNGQEAIFLTNGGSVEIVARSQGSGRGFTVDVIVCDEAQDMSDDDLEALLSTSSAAPSQDPQWIFTGTPPGPKARGEVFARVRSDALDKSPHRLSWLEWSMDVDGDLDDRKQWRQANPALGTRLQMSVVEGERARFSDEGFARERGGMWAADVLGKGVIPSLSWNAQVDTESTVVDRPSIGIEVGPDLAWCSIAVAGKRADGDWHIGLAHNQNTQGVGVEWLMPRLDELLASRPDIRTVVIDVSSPIKAMIEQRGKRYFLKRPDGSRGIEVHALKVAELGVGCTSLLSGVVTGSAWHIGQPQLTSAALSAGKRPLGDTGMWVWNRRSADSDITPIQAATYALIGAQLDKPVPARRASGSRGSRESSRGRRAVVI